MKPRRESAAASTEASIAPQAPLEYAALGYPVFPCKQGKKTPATQNGFKDAATDELAIRQWLAERPQGNWGLLPPEGVLVLDCDSAEALERLLTEYPELANAPLCRTPRGGGHLYVRWPDGNTPPRTRAGALPDVDIRGLARAYLVAPPSKTAQGAYGWERPLVAVDDLPVCPGGLVEALTPKRKRKAPPAAPSVPECPESGYGQAALERECSNVAAAPEGQRNDTLNAAAFSLGQLVAGGALERGQAEGELLAAALLAGLPEDEARQTITSGLDAGELEPRTAPEPTAKGKRRRKKAAATDEPAPEVNLVELAQQHVAELWHDPEGEPYATVPADGHLENYPLRSRIFKTWLERLHYLTAGYAAKGQHIQDALGALSGIARFEGPGYPVYTRLARLADRLYLDLADDAWRVVEIDADGWRVLDQSPVKFRRPKGMLPLPVPIEGGGQIGKLRDYLNVEAAAWPLVLGWLVACYAPAGPYPVLILTAEQGSGKTTTARFLRSLIDPNLAPLRSEPREARDLMIAARNGAVAMFDNLSRIPAQLSDDLCRLATGGGFGTRTLYTDDEETLFDATRPLLLTGIDDLADRGDLLDRAIIVGCRPINGTARRPERELWADFHRDQPALLGALLTAVATGLRDLPHTKLPSLPRMADATLWVTACEPALALEPGSFARAYIDNQQQANEMALDVSPLPAALRELLAAKPTWQGTATELLTELDERANERTQRLKAWPKSARALGNLLRRLAPNLRATGVEVEFAREGKERTRIIRISQDVNVRNVRNVRQEEKTRLGRENEADVKADAKSTADVNVRLTSATSSAIDMQSGTQKPDVADEADKADAKSTAHSNLSWDEV